MEATLETISDKASFWKLFRRLCASREPDQTQSTDGQKNLLVHYQPNAIINFGKLLAPRQRLDGN